ncbi:MAG: TonB-dependent receptor plug domain-containing protein, partial [Steroidobacter sp.]
MRNQRYGNFLLFSSFAATVFWAASAHSDDTSVIVTGTRLPRAVADEVPSVDVVTREDIDARQPRSAVDLLRDIPGVWADQPGGPGSVSSVYVRGADPNFTLVLIDGVRVNDSTNSRGGSFDLSALTPDSIERVEVVRGVRSAAYGSDALAGVINIITATGADKPEASIETGFGSDGYHHVNARLLGPLNGARAALTAGVTDYGEPSTDHQLTVRHANAKLEADLRANTKVSVFGRFVDTEAKSYPDESGGPLFATLRTLEQRESEQISGGFNLEHAFDDDNAIEFRVDASDRNEVTDSPGVAPGLRDPFGIPASHYDSEYTTLGAASSLRGRLSEQLRGVVGVEWRQEQGESDSVRAFGGFDLPGRFDLQ